MGEVSMPNTKTRKRKTITLKGEAARAFVRAMSGREPTTVEQQLDETCLAIHLELSNHNDKGARAILKQAIEDATQHPKGDLNLENVQRLLETAQQFVSCDGYLDCDSQAERSSGI